MSESPLWIAATGQVQTLTNVRFRAPIQAKSPIVCGEEQGAKGSV